MDTRQYALSIASFHRYVVLKSAFECPISMGTRPGKDFEYSNIETKQVSQEQTQHAVALPC